MKNIIIIPTIAIALCATFVSCSADDDTFSTMQNPVEQTGVLMSKDSLSPLDNTIGNPNNPGGTGDDDIIPIKPPKKPGVLMARDSITTLDNTIGNPNNPGGTGDDDIIPIKPPKKP